MHHTFIIPTQIGYLLQTRSAAYLTQYPLILLDDLLILTELLLSNYPLVSGDLAGQHQ
jgi:hypothetical protein